MVVHSLTAACLARRFGLALGFAAMACSSSGKSTGPIAPDDAGDAGRPGPREAGTAPVMGQGDVAVTVEWKQPPARALRSPGANRCGGERRPALSVHAAGGVRGVVVALDQPAVAGDHEVATLVVRDCQLTPRVATAIGSPWRLRVINRDERHHQLRLVAGGKVIQTAELRVFGHRYELEGQVSGMVRVDLGEDRGVAYVYAAPRGRFAVTDERGRVRFSGLNAGRHEGKVVHSPLDSDGAPIERSFELDLAANQTVEQTVALTP